MPLETLVIVRCGYEWAGPICANPGVPASREMPETRRGPEHGALPPTRLITVIGARQARPKLLMQLGSIAGNAILASGSRGVDVKC